MTKQWPSGPELRRKMFDRLDGKTLLSFSRGKDSVASWLTLRAEGWEVVPFTLTMIPDGLRVENEAIAYYEEVFETPIRRLTHPLFFTMLDDGVFQPPERWTLWDEIGIPYSSYDEIHRIMRAETGLTWVAVGTRAMDSISRRTNIARNGPTSLKRKMWQPIYDMRMDGLVDLVSRSGVKLAADYRVWGRSFDGLAWPYLIPLREHYPDDFERVLKWFPLAWTQLRRFAGGLNA